ncbi:hypothetical protein [Shewanella frigidimarina]|uniref:hypothetical protein n=1 Tax=Shewanella frigidimarina TaxID=56812 RepID=UPI003D79D8CB
MFKYVIFYDLHNGRGRYKPLWSFLEALGARRLQKSVWTLETDLFDLETLRYCLTFATSEKDQVNILSTPDKFN